MYFAYLISAVSLMTLSWWRFRSVLHPHFALTVIIVVMFMSDFLIRGYDDDNLSNIPSSDVFVYQLLVLLACLLIVTGAFLIAQTKPVPRVYFIVRPIFERQWARRLLTIAWALALAELLKRLYSTDWSVSTMLAQSLAARGSQSWAGEFGEVMEGIFLYQLILALLPFSALVFGYFSVMTRGVFRIAAIGGFLVVVTLLVLDGTRGPVFFALAGLAVFYVCRSVPFTRKALMSIVMAAVIAAIGSLILLFRAGGLGEAIAGKSNGEYRILYHQDDSYYRSLRAMYLAEHSNERWDGVTYLYAIAVNPIPRYFWAGKPLLTQQYWGDFKLDYVTITYLGEFVAIFGITVGLVATILTGWVLFWLLQRAAMMLHSPAGILVYLVSMLYVYMIMRSSLNVTHFVYLPLFAYIVIRLNPTNRKSAKAFL